MARDRGLLTKDRLEEFATWAVARGYQREPVKGNYEVLRLRKKGDPPITVWARGGETHPNPHHVTVYGAGLKLAKKFIRDTKETAK